MVETTKLTPANIVKQMNLQEGDCLEWKFGKVSGSCDQKVEMGSV